MKRKEQKVSELSLVRILIHEGSPDA